MAALERRFAARLACMVLLSSTACTLVLPLAPVAQDAPASQPGGAMGVTATHILVAGEVCTDVAAVCGGNLVCGPEGFCTTPCSSDDDCPGAGTGSCDPSAPQAPRAPLTACDAGLTCAPIGDAAHRSDAPLGFICM